ncbi:glycosyltransferase [Mycobacterium sp. 1165178.9]|uniref:glycosyltransferase n=1 Tax=Mycobacterium sp. 1165178.9 TaxID=1834070 RepID=UPI0007FF8741|nr:glycosyltransferase [Mycobacterium sp. 1165178.9]OBK88049.1 glycosyl transferase family 1 [Mycobacterium sp. 1165178.9]
MKFVLACYGTRGDVEPVVAVGRELLARGHDVRMAVSPGQIGFAEAAGVPAVAYGLERKEMLDAHRNFWRALAENPWRIRNLIKVWRESWEPSVQYWGQMSRTLTELADGADLIFTGLAYQEIAADVAEYHNIPLATLDHIPLRPNGQLVPFLPGRLGRAAIVVGEWLIWGVWKKTQDAQRRELGLPKAKRPAPERITTQGSLEIQAYDESCFPGLAAEWARWNSQRPFVGALTMELPTDSDDEILSWVSAGSPPIYFGFGSMPVESPTDTISMISAACAQLGERALVCSGWSDFGEVPDSEHVKVVGAVNHAAILPACRAVVHHGGAGTTAAGLRAGVPTLILWMLGDQPLWGARVKRLKVGTARRFSSVTQESLVADLRTILAPEYVTRAREFATHMTKSAESVANTAALLQDFARLRRVG